MVKNNVVPGEPNGPTACDQDFSEDPPSKYSSSLDNHVKRLKVGITDYRQEIPADDTEGTFKK